MGAPPSATGEVVLERLQSLSHADLRRLVPRLFPDEYAPVWCGAACTIAFREGQTLRIELGPEAERRLGALRIVSTPLRLAFLGWSQGDFEAATRRLEQALQQGGG